MFCGIEYNCAVYPTVGERVNPQSWCLTERLVALCTTVALFSTVGCDTIWYKTSSFSGWIVALTVCQWVTENLTKTESKTFFRNQKFLIPNPKLFSIPFFSETNTDIFSMPKIFDTESDTFFSKPFPKPKPTPILISIPKFCNTESNTFFNTKFHHHHGWTYGFTSHLFYLLTVGKTIIIVIARQWVKTFSLWLYEFKMVPYFQNYEKILLSYISILCIFKAPEQEES